MKNLNFPKLEEKDLKKINGGGGYYVWLGGNQYKWVYSQGRDYGGGGDASPDMYHD